MPASVRGDSAASKPVSGSARGSPSARSAVSSSNAAMVPSPVANGAYFGVVAS